MYLSSRLRSLKPSETLAISARAKALKAQGKDVIVLAAGEPDFAPPAHIREAVARHALDAPARYGAAAGDQPARKALADHLSTTRGVAYGPDQIVLTNGGKHAIWNALAALVDPGDRVLVLAPYWVTYPAQVGLLGGESVMLYADDDQGFKVTADQMREALSTQIRCVIFNNPSNPSGAYYRPEEVRALTQVCVDADVPILSDEVYDAIVFDGSTYLSPAAVSAEATELTVLTGSLSKTYAMPGWRIGFVAGPAEWIEKVTSYQGQVTHHPSALAQAAATAAFSGGQEGVAVMRDAFRDRRDYLLQAFSGIPGFEVAVPPQGAFYLFPRVTGLIDRVDGVTDDAALCDWLLDTAGVALIPGSAFGAPGFVRLSYAASMEELKDAISRIARTVDTL